MKEREQLQLLKNIEIYSYLATLKKVSLLISLISTNVVNLSTLVLLVSIYNPIILTRAKKLLVASEGDKSCNMKWQQSFAFINNSRETKGPTTNQQGGVYGCDRNFCDWFFIALKKWEEKRELHILKNGLEEKKFGLKSKNKFWWVCTSLSGNVI